MAPILAARSARPLRRTLAIVCIAMTVNACGSDEKAAPATAGADVTSSASAPATAAATDTTAASAATGADERVAAIVAYMVSDAASSGFELDPECLADKVGELDEVDLALLYAGTQDTAPDATIPELSSAGEAIGEQVIQCLPGGGEPGDPELVEEAVAAVIAGEGGTVDEGVEECLQENLADLSNEQLQLLIDEGPETTNPAAAIPGLAVLDCVGLSFSGSTDSLALGDAAEAPAVAVTATPVTDATASPAAVIPTGWPADLPVIHHELKRVSVLADPDPTGAFVVITEGFPPAVLQVTIDEWATALGVTCSFELDTAEPQPCDGPLPNGQTMTVLVNEDALYSDNPRVTVTFA